MNFLAVELEEELSLKLTALVSQQISPCQFDSVNLSFVEKDVVRKSLEPYDLVFIDQAVLNKEPSTLMWLNTQKTPYITTSVKNDSVIALEAMRNGAEDHLTVEDLDSDKMVLQRIRSAIARSSARADMIEQNQVLKLTLDDAGHGVVAANSAGEFTMFNQTAEKIIGVGKTFSSQEEWAEVYGIYEKDKKTKMMTADLPLVKVLGGFHVLREHIFVKNNRLEEGNHIICTGRPFASGGVVLISDITEDVRAKERIEQYAHHLEQSNMELSQFSYRTSHDLKAPLITIRGLSKAVAEDIESRNYKEAKANAEKIGRQVRKLEALVANILNLAKADLNETVTEVVSVSEVIADIKERLEAVYVDNDVVFVANIDPSIVFHSSKTRLTQILENLISNSIKYCDKKKNSRYVHISTYTKDGANFISVEDNGMGIPEEFAGKVFQMFQRFHPEISYG
ncbi:MAG: ATP-binding protein, partial [Gammaproteobacteria bacterium]